MHPPISVHNPNIPEQLHNEVPMHYLKRIFQVPASLLPTVATVLCLFGRICKNKFKKLILENITGKIHLNIFKIINNNE